MRRLSGFSLMEMMVVLLIVAIVAAASAPMVSKKLSGADSVAGIGCLWKTHDEDNYSVTYNSVARGNKSVIIGAKKTNVNEGSSNKPRLFVSTKSADNPHMRFSTDSEDYDLQVWSNGIWFSNNTINKNISEYVAIGDDISAANSSVVIGAGSSASGTSSTAVGYSSEATSTYSTALGYDSTASGSESVALGHKATASSSLGIAIGYNSILTDNAAIAIGENTNPSGGASVAIGSRATTSGGGAVAVGQRATAGNTYAVAIGNSSSAGLNSVAYGGSSSANSYATAVGYGANANADCVAIGNNARAQNSGAVAIGKRANHACTAGYGSVALGFETNASAGGAIAIGTGTSATGNNGIAIGQTVSAGSNQVRIGSDSHEVKLGGCTFENGVIKAKRIEVEDLNVGSSGFLADKTGASSTNLTVTNLDVINVDTSNLYVSNNANIGSLDVRGDADLNINSGSTYIRATGTHGKIYSMDEDAGDRGYLRIINDCDRRLKNVGEVFTAGLEEIKKLEVFNYVYKKDTTKTPRVGVMAQDLMKIFPNAVFKGDDGFYRIRMEDMFYALVNAVKELDKKIDLLAEKQKKIDELEKRVDTLEKRLEKLEKRK